MSEPKVIELTAKEFDLFQINDRKREIHEALQSGQDVLLKAPQTKLVHLSNLPDGTKIGAGAYVGWMHKGELWLRKTANEIYEESRNVHGKELSLKKGEWQIWQGGECPWPEHVEVEVMLRGGAVMCNEYRFLDWAHHPMPHENEIIAHRCTGRLLDGAKVVP